MTKYISVVALVIAIVALFSPIQNIEISENLQGSTADNWTVGKGRTSSATTSVTVEHAGTKGGCLVMKQADGTGYGYVFITPTGSLATTTAAGC